MPVFSHAEKFHGIFEMHQISLVSDAACWLAAAFANLPGGFSSTFGKSSDWLNQISGCGYNARHH